MFTNQSSFKNYYSCIKQLLSFTHDVPNSYANGFGVCGVLLDIRKIFDKVWQYILEKKEFLEYYQMC